MQIPFFLLSKETQARIIEQERRQAEAHAKRAMERTKNCVEWTPNIKWAPELNIIASTYKPDILFDGVEPTDKIKLIHTLEKGQFVDSPTGKYRFTVNILRKGKTLHTINRSTQGNVVFDDDVLIPALYQNRDNDYGNPWISITPMEILTLRPGTRRAKGHTIVAGLGLGYQLSEVAKKKSVKRITLVERDQELTDWILPRLCERYPIISDKLGQTIIGDAHEVLKDMCADVALIDIFSGYGSNELYCYPKNIGTVWCWGACHIKGDDCWYY